MMRLLSPGHVWVFSRTVRVLQNAGSVGIMITTQESDINMDKTLMWI